MAPIVPCREPSGGWALAIDQTETTLLGVAVISPAGDWRIVSVSNDGSRFEVRDLAGWTNTVCFIELPNHPRPVAMQSFVANSALGRSQSLVPLTPRPGGSRKWVDQWALLRLVEQLGAIWQDPDRRGDTVGTGEEKAGNPKEEGGFRSIRIQADGRELISIIASGPPFSRLPSPDDFLIDHEVENGRATFTGFHLRACQPSDNHGIRELMAKESSAFDEADLNKVQLQIQLATRAGRFGEPLAGRQCQFASADYWVLVGTIGMKESVLGVVGILQFYGVPEEIWVGYLCKHGSILTETILRRCRDLGFYTLYVWTTPDNQNAIDWYLNRGGFSRTTTSPHEDLSGQPFVAFERSTLPDRLMLSPLSS